MYNFYILIKQVFVSIIGFLVIVFSTLFGAANMFKQYRVKQALDRK